MVMVRAVVGIFAIAFGIVFITASIYCQLASWTLGLDNQFGLRQGCMLRHDGQWKLIKDIMGPKRRSPSTASADPSRNERRI